MSNRRGSASQGRRYRVNEIARMAGVSVRTLHHYDDCGLLTAQRAENGYRLYGPREIERLQQILLYRDAGLGLREIAQVLDAPAFDALAALREHRSRLALERERIDRLIESVEATIASLEKGTEMEDERRFAALKRAQVKQNEREYGAEAREKWGDEAVDASNDRYLGLSKGDFEKAERLTERMRELACDLAREGCATGDEGATFDARQEARARELARLHGEWLELFWPEGMYSAQAHRGIADLYEADPRFQEHYEAWCDGAARILIAAIRLHCGE